MASFLGKGISLLCDTTRLIDAIDEMHRRNEFEFEDGLAKASLALKLTNLGFTITEIGMILCGAKSKSLKTLKEMESVSRFFNVPVEIVAQSINGSREADMISFIKKGIIVPMSELMRTAAQTGVYREKTYLEMTPDELKDAKRPIYEYNAHYEVSCVGHEPVDLKDCSQRLNRAICIADSSALVRLATTVLDTSLPVYERLFAYLRGLPIPLQREAPAQGARPAEIRQDPNDEMNFQEFSTIPVPLHEDAVFSRFVCAITLLPIRDPVRDPTAPPHVKVLYERDAILRWLQINNSSPYTRQELAPDQLIECPALKLVIDDRLEHHSQGFRQYLQNGLNSPVSNGDQAIIREYS